MNNDDDFSDTLRQNLAIAETPQPEVGQAQRVVRSVLHRRAQQRQRWAVAGAGLAVVLAVGGLTTVLDQAAPGSSVTSASSMSPITSWTPRGSLLGDAALIERAQQVWTQAAPRDLTRPGGPTVLYAGPAIDPTAAPLVTATIVVMRDQDPEGHVTLAYVTSPLSAKGSPENRQSLSVRARATVPFGSENAPAIGFMATTPATGDEPLPAPVSFGWALTDPSVTQAHFTTSIVDDEMSDSANMVGDGAVAYLGPIEAGAWNTQIVVGTGDTATKVALTASVHDPLTTPVTITAVADGTFQVTGVSAKVGDLVATQSGVLGLVASANASSAVVNPDLQATAASLGARAETAVTNKPGTLSTADDGTLSFSTTDTSYQLAKGNRIVLHGFATAATVLNLGRVTAGPAGTWTLQRSAPLPTGPTAGFLMGQ